MGNQRDIAPVPVSSDRSPSIPTERPSIDIRNHLAGRRAVADALARQSVRITKKRYSYSGTSFRVLVGKQYFDVDERELAMLQANHRPEELDLTPVNDEAEDWL